MNKKGILGFDTVKAVILAIGILAIFVIISLVTLVTLRTAVDSADMSSGNVINESITRPTTALGTEVAANVLRNPICNNFTTVYNGTTGTLIDAALYNQTNCYIANVTNVTNTSATWLISYSYSYDQPYTTSVVDNISIGSSSFFAQVPTFFVLLGVVVLILIIAIVIVAVSRFRTGQNIESM